MKTLLLNYRHDAGALYIYIYTYIQCVALCARTKNVPLQGDGTTVLNPMSKNIASNPLGLLWDPFGILRAPFRVLLYPLGILWEMLLKSFGILHETKWEPSGNQLRPSGDQMGPGGDQMKPSGNRMEPNGDQKQKCLLYTSA